MSTPKGYSSQTKKDRTTAEFATVSPAGYEKFGLDVVDKSVVHIVASDAAEAGSTTAIIKATGHLAKKGDRLRFTSGANDTVEVDIVDVATDEITVGADLASAPIALDTFDILRPTSMTVDPSGAIAVTATPIKFVLDSVDTEVTEDTVTPSNNTPLPVKLTGVTGDVNITAGDLNVQTSHLGAGFDSQRIGDGVETVEVNAAGEMQVADDTARTSLASLDGKATANLIDANNSSSTPLGIAGVFTGPATDVSKYKAIAINLFADQDSAVDGMSFEFSSDGVNWDDVNSFNLDIATSQARRFQFPVTHQFFRVVYTNGGVAQTAFRVQTILHTDNILTSIHRVDGALNGDRSVTVTKSVLSGETTAGGGAFVNVKVNPSGTLETNASQATHDDLNANANMQVGNVDVAGGNPVPMSASALPLPSGAATEASLSTVAGDTTSLDAKAPALGAALIAASTPVNIASDQTVPISASALPLPAGAATEASLATVAGDTTSLDSKQPAQGAALIAASVPVNIASDQTVPVSASALPLPSGAATSALQTSANALLSSMDADTSILAALDTNAGAVGATTRRVHLSDESLAALENITVEQASMDIKDLMDAPLLDASSSNIPAVGSLPLQIVASLAADVKKIQILDTTGGFLGLYTGAAAAEVLKLVIGPGSDNTIDASLLSGTRISVKSLEASLITVGNLSMNFVG